MAFKLKGSKSARTIYDEKGVLAAYIAAETLDKESTFNSVQITFKAISLGSVHEAGDGQVKMEVWLTPEHMKETILLMQEVLAVLK